MIASRECGAALKSHGMGLELHSHHLFTVVMFPALKVAHGMEYVRAKNYALSRVGADGNASDEVGISR